MPRPFDTELSDYRGMPLDTEASPMSAPTFGNENIDVPDDGRTFTDDGRQYASPTPVKRPLADLARRGVQLVEDKLKANKFPGAMGAAAIAAKTLGKFNLGEEIANFAGIPGLRRTLDRAAYGERLTSGSGETAHLLPDTVDASLWGASALGVGRRATMRAVDAAVRHVGPPRHGQLNMFVAPTNKADVLKAEELEKKGVSPEAIHLQTGLHRSPTPAGDGPWLAEISDAKATSTAIKNRDEKNSGNVRRLQEIEQAMYLKGSLEQGLTKEEAVADFVTQFGKEPTWMVAERAANHSVDELSAAWDAAADTIKTFSTVTPTQQVLNHPKLYARYPDIAARQTHVRPLDTETGGHFDPSTRDVHLNSLNNLSDDRARSVLLHEGQHSVQHADGRDYGANFDAIFRAKSNESENLRVMYDTMSTLKAAKILMDQNPGMPPQIAIDTLINQANHYGDSAHYVPGGIYRTYLERELGNPLTSVATIDPSLNSLRQRFKAAPTISKNDAYKLYMRNLGEQEARATQKRADLTDAERRHRFPLLDYDDPTRALTQTDVYGPGQIPLSASMSASRSEDLDGYFLKSVERLPARMVNVPKTHLQQELNRPDVTQAEKDVVNKVLEENPEQAIPKDVFLNKLDEAIGPLKLTATQTDEYANYGLSSIRPGHQSVSFGRGTSVGSNDMRTTIYKSPIEISDNNHFNEPNYFGHTRSFDEDGVRHVVEVQSDVAQHFKPVTPEVRAKIEKEMGYLSNDMDAYDSVKLSLPNVWERVSLSFKERTLAALNEDYGGDFDTHSLDSIDSAIMDRNPGAMQRSLLVKIAQAARTARYSTDLDYNELKARLGTGEEANVLAPMVKNWPKRLVREEIAQVARETAPETRKYLEGLKATHERQLAELMKARFEDQGWGRLGFTKDEIRKIEGRLSNKIKFATADTVAKVEGWPVSNSGKYAEEQRLLGELSEDILARNPGISDDALDRLLTKRSPEVAEKLREYVKNIPTKDRLQDYRIRLELEADADPEEIAKIPQRMKTAEESLKRAQAYGQVFRNPEHAGIYLRHRKEVEEFLKKDHDGIPVTDSRGHTWVEVPIQPQNRRVQLLGVGAGAASAGLPYSMSDQIGED